MTKTEKEKEREQNEKEREEALDKEFVTWQEETVARLKAMDYMPVSPIQECQFHCENKVPVAGSDEKEVCDHVIRYRVCNKEILEPYATESKAGMFGILGGDVGFLADAPNPLYYKRIKPYLWKNGFIACERCFAVYRVVKHD